VPDGDPTLAVWESLPTAGDIASSRRHHPQHLRRHLAGGHPPAVELLGCLVADPGPVTGGVAVASPYEV
jgi:hypothetical protein